MRSKVRLSHQTLPAYHPKLNHIRQFEDLDSSLGSTGRNSLLGCGEESLVELNRWRGVWLLAGIARDLGLCAGGGGYWILRTAYYLGEWMLRSTNLLAQQLWWLISCTVASGFAMDEKICSEQWRDRHLFYLPSPSLHVHKKTYLHNPILPPPPPTNPPNPH